MDWQNFLNLAAWLKVLISSVVFFFVLKGLLRLSLQRFRETPINHPKFYRVFLKIFSLQLRSVYVLVLSLFLGSSIFARSESWFLMVKNIFFLLSMFQLWFWIQALIRTYVDRKTAELNPDDRSKSTSFRALAFIAYLAVLILIFLFTLDNFGVNITALVAGLGVGGVAVALAVQNILGDLFASITIILDKPFVVGDLIVVGDVTGNIESIGIKTTRVRSISGEVVVFSNADLLQSRIRNFHSVYERRVMIPFGVLYETPRRQVEEIPEIVRSILSKVPQTRLDRVHFIRFGESSLDFEVVFYSLTPDFYFALDCQQRVQLGMMEEFEKRGIGFAYPTRTLHVSKLNPAVDESLDLQ